VVTTLFEIACSPAYCAHREHNAGDDPANVQLTDQPLLSFDGAAFTTLRDEFRPGASDPARELNERVPLSCKCATATLSSADTLSLSSACCCCAPSASSG
jgi:hypothetical protein